ncbi:unnamed protein product [Larinioides sclopetarius]|uniref:Ycf15 n=1 Tax=Larinioides sclopetarius TaxID=280406 RepID=A0AAV2A9D6_9ARAC
MHSIPLTNRDKSQSLISNPPSRNQYLSPCHRDPQRNRDEIKSRISCLSFSHCNRFKRGTLLDERPDLWSF